ncbi:hypothetical protein A3D71_02500 [Candidatus Kaiserbacteria bacterium RIFCSPHIGHO2_02_FULL_55_20]|uniref:Uncharacterized protein n=1 Tax=Candidatus Kaiserbacteria bacterium RIFCSPHIGHO2_02_FULL_55_20 TaxID=1798497 RepID=A0A1F6DYJ9_9BACT|nr:MAG: hypothetical protein A2680_01970 [Candidatus Kaiserbacteria bacterium RIFCSPHIGHO2_01_FULL_55_37]OGG66417.1 MAG: hypothetical protein A3D71_02500 [Candidatus Kaiserbacteria bacterium RIFCSPHIGHO2_02_FULL_55_20]
MKLQTTKSDKRSIRRAMHLTRPPRMEGRVKEAMMQPVRKKKAAVKRTGVPKKIQGYTEKQRKDYHLKSRRSK